LNAIAKVVATHMLPEDVQRSNEFRFSRKHIDGYITEAITTKPQFQAMVVEGEKRVINWISAVLAADGYASKKRRLKELQALNISELVHNLIVGSAYFQIQDTFVSCTAMLARHLDFDDRRDAIVTVAELCAVLCWTGAFTIWKEEVESSMMFKSNLVFPKQLTESIKMSMYLPPMVCKPSEVTTNFESPYLTHNDSRILGKKNGHTGDICLDHLNRQTAVALRLDTDFLSTVEELPTFELDTLEKIQGWSQFKHDSYCTYLMIVQQGNQMWLDHKVDKRGRDYAQGYHITTQGSPFKKAMIELHKEELIEGVPICTV
jgi:hypothetical protein